MHKTINIKSITLPREHGSWAYIIEPLMLGLIAAFSVKGLFLAASSVFVFLLHQPVRVFFSAGRKIRQPAVFFILLYAAIAGFFIIMFLKNTDFLTALPFFIALVLMTLYLVLELAGLDREFSVRLMAPISTALIAASLVMAGGWNFDDAAVIFLLVNLRFIPTAFYIRSRFKQSSGKESKRIVTSLVHLLSLITASAVIYLGRMPILPFIGVSILFGRAVYGLFIEKGPVIPKRIGVKEFIFGILYTLICAAGYYTKF